ncbi:NAD(P)-dependent oxidoreductase [Egibacter rhizosphaerae]|uniref:NAD(P)-dependent oxidoreductase n=2 Tax=Egibacter rhizosphaerae TaxID=1670831 RepID=A0A411YL88_9ACTN|nr:NAD(P)-dependent oxidoreductase [Egibacter rhizosphaerae]
MQPHVPSDTTVTVLGLGLMGRALAHAFLRSGHPTTVWNRTPAKAEQLIADGAVPAESAAEAVAASPLVVVCVTDGDAVRDVLGSVDARVLEGRVVVNLTSSTSEEARQIAEWATGSRATYLAGAISASPSDIGGEGAAILYAGPRWAFDQHAGILEPLAAGTTYLGEDHGLASLYDAATLGLMWGILNAYLHGAALLEAAGVDAVTFAPLASAGVRTVVDWLPGIAEQVDTGRYPAVDASLDIHVAAMGHLLDENESLGIDTGLPRFVKDLADRAVAAGHGGSDYAAMIEQFRKPAGHFE